MTDPHVERLRRLDACAVSDALESLGLAGAALGLRPLSVRRRIAGRAVTVDLVEAGQVTAGRHLCTAAVDAAGSDDVIVVAHHGRVHAAGWGGVLSAGATTKGVAGVVVDGAVRDLDEALDYGLPVYAITAVPVTARGKIVERDWNVPITISEIRVEPLDYVIADHSGVVFVPAKNIGDVLHIAEQIVVKEKSMADRARAGEPMVTVMSRNYETMLEGGQQ